MLKCINIVRLLQGVTDDSLRKQVVDLQTDKANYEAATKVCSLSYLLFFTDILFAAYQSPLTITIATTKMSRHLQSLLQLLK